MPDAANGNRVPLQREPRDEYVVICGKETLGPFRTYGDAIAAGRARCPNDDFVVKLVHAGNSGGMEAGK
jgi:hypothetical protein